MELIVALLEADQRTEADRFFYTEVKMAFSGNLSAFWIRIRIVTERCGNVRISLSWTENMCF